MELLLPLDGDELEEEAVEGLELDDGGGVLDEDDPPPPLDDGPGVDPALLLLEEDTPLLLDGGGVKLLELEELGTGGPLLPLDQDDDELTGSLRRCENPRCPTRALPHQFNRVRPMPSGRARLPQLPWSRVLRSLARYERGRRTTARNPHRRSRPRGNRLP